MVQIVKSNKKIENKGAFHPPQNEFVANHMKKKNYMSTGLKQINNTIKHDKKKRYVN